jgi:uncharacterized metal-binding protein
MNGRAHRFATLTAAPLVALAAGYASGDLGTAIAAGAGCYAGLFIHPDWDIDHAAPLWRKPYAKLLKHRSWLSHGPVVGTLGRLSYLMLPWLLVELAMLWVGRSEPLFYLTWRQLALVLAGVAGLMVSDALHWCMDWKLWLIFKRSTKRQRKHWLATSSKS